MGNCAVLQNVKFCRLANFVKRLVFVHVESPGSDVVELGGVLGSILHYVVEGLENVLTVYFLNFL